MYNRQFDRTGGEKAQDSLHTLPDTWAWEGVPLQPVPDTSPTNWDCTHTVSLRETNQNMVSKPQNEMEKGQQNEEYEYGGSRKRIPALNMCIL